MIDRINIDVPLKIAGMLLVSMRSLQRHTDDHQEKALASATAEVIANAIDAAHALNAEEQKDALFAAMPEQKAGAADDLGKGY